MALAVVGPAKRENLPLAAAGQQEEADRGGRAGGTAPMRGEGPGQAADLLVGQEPFAALEDKAFLEARQRAFDRDRGPERPPSDRDFSVKSGAAVAGSVVEGMCHDR